MALALPAGADFAPPCTACLRSGAIAVPVDLRLSEPSAAVIGARTSSTRHPTPRPTPTPDARRPTPGDCIDPHLRHHRRARGRSCSRTATGPRDALGLGRRARPTPRTSGGCAACRSPTSAACGSSCARPSTRTTVVLHERFDAAHVATALHEGVTGASLVPTCSSECSTPARSARRCCAARSSAAARCAARAARPRARRRHPRRPDLRPHRGVLPGHRRGAGRGHETAGRPLPGTEVAIDAGGEILVRGPPSRRPRATPTASSTPATSACSTATAACRGRPQQRDRSSPAARTSPRPRSRPRSRPTPPWPRPRCSVAPTPNGASGFVAAVAPLDSAEKP